MDTMTNKQAYERNATLLYIDMHVAPYLIWNQLLVSINRLAQYWEESEHSPMFEESYARMYNKLAPNLE